MTADHRKPGAAPSLSPAAVAALHLGNKIEAIKIVREELNVGLKEAKELVDDYVRTQPALQSSLAAAQAEANQKALVWLAALAAAALVAYYVLAAP